MFFVLFSISIALTGCFFKGGVEVSEEISTEALEIALRQQGKPYVWGGRGPDVFDCSGLITWAYKSAVGRDRIFSISGYKTTDATMSDLYDWNVSLIPLEKAAPGDIIFFDEDDKITHGGLFIKWMDDSESEFEFVHASSAAGGVIVDSWIPGETRRKHSLTGAGRFKVAR